MQNAAIHLKHFQTQNSHFLINFLFRKKMNIVWNLEYEFSQKPIFVNYLYVVSMEISFSMCPIVFLCQFLLQAWYIVTFKVNIRTKHGWKMYIIMMMMTTTPIAMSFSGPLKTSFSWNIEIISEFKETSVFILIGHLL